MTIKQKLHVKCMELMDQKLAFLQNALLDLAQGAQNDTKSSAGDKHETARAMMQIEQEKLGRQVAEAKVLKAELERINPEIVNQQVGKGSLVKTNLGYLYIGVGLGKIVVDTNSIMTLSAESPLGKQLMGLTANSSLQINGTRYLVEEIY
jgi:transcription elongation GreA/GreB family factor